MTELDDYVFAKWPWQRCRAFFREEGFPHYGRCDRMRRHAGPHVLERGLEYVVWVTRYERYMTIMGEFMVGLKVQDRIMKARIAEMEAEEEDERLEHQQAMAKHEEMMADMNEELERLRKDGPSSTD